MGSLNKADVRLFDTPVGVTNVNVGDYFVYTGLLYDPNTEHWYELKFDNDPERACPTNTILKLTEIIPQAYLSPPKGVRAARQKLQVPRMLYRFEAKIHVPGRVGVYNERVEKFTCTVNAYDVRELIDLKVLKKVDARLHQTAFPGVARRQVQRPNMLIECD
jgi:hypothetical protein